jgi:hypothetical protein
MALAAVGPAPRGGSIVSPSAFLERIAPPGTKELEAVLGGSRALWDRLLAVVLKVASLAFPRPAPLP